MEKSKKRQSASSRNTPIFCLLTAAVTLVSIIFLGEVGARLFFKPHTIPPVPPPDRINPYRPNPYVVNLRPYIFFHLPGARCTQKLFTHDNEYNINSMGFRSSEFTRHPPKGWQRLLIIGDSVVEGHGVQPEETFAALLNNRMKQDKWEVLNLGVQGSSPVYYAANLERYLYLNPDAVLLVIHENDLYDDEVREQSYFDFPVLESRAELFAGGTGQPLLEKSYLFKLLRTSFHTLKKTELENIIDANRQLPGIHAVRDSDRKLSSFAVPEKSFARRMDMSRKYLTFTMEKLREQGVDMMISSLCTVTQAMPSITAYTEHCRRLDEGIAQWADAYNVPYISLVPTMKQALDDHKTKDILIINDFHPTPFMHSLLADDLSPFLAKQLTEKN